eukprot:gene6023-4326_t
MPFHKRRCWYSAATVVGAVGVAAGGRYLYMHSHARRAADREKGILQIAAVALSKETLKDIIADKEVLHDLKQVGLNILKAPETKESLKSLLKERVSNRETKETLKKFSAQVTIRDLWVEEELLHLLGDIANGLKNDETIFPMPLLSRVGDAALEGLSSDMFKQTVKTEVLKVVGESLLLLLLVFASESRDVHSRFWIINVRESVKQSWAMTAKTVSNDCLSWFTSSLICTQLGILLAKERDLVIFLIMSSSKKIELVKEGHGRKVYSVQGQPFDVEQRYTVTGCLGRGAYGIVCAAVDEEANQRVAIKCVSRIFEELTDGRRIWREMVVLRLLRQCKCRNVLQLFTIQEPTDSIATFRDVYMVTDLYAMDLFSLNRVKALKTDFIRIVIAKVLQCIADMHSLGMIHRDIKPSNILLRSAEDASSTVVCDFGLARAGLQHFNLPMRMTDYVVTRWYRPPELLLGCPYDYAVDVWSVGCVLGECVLRAPLFPGRDYIHQLQLVLASVPVTGVDFILPSGSPSISHIRETAKRFQGLMPLPQLLQKLPPDGLDAVTKMLAFEPAKRVTAQGALKHTFFETVPEVNDPSPITEAPPDQFGFDLHTEVSESQLRRLIFDEIRSYRKRKPTRILGNLSQEAERSHLVQSWRSCQSLIVFFFFLCLS